MSNFTIEILGMEKLLRKLRADALLHAPWRRAMNAASYTILAELQNQTPVDTGRLRSSMRTAIDPDPMPLWAMIGAPKGLKYVKPLEFGTGLLSLAADSKRQRYNPPMLSVGPWGRRHGFGASDIAAGKRVADLIFRRGGTRPAGMFKETVERTRSKIAAIVAKAAADIAAAWKGP